MKRIPTSHDIFGLDCLGEDASDAIKLDFVFYCVDECVSKTLSPYKEYFNNKTFRFKQGEMELLSGPEGYIFDENDSNTPVNVFMNCNSFMKIKGTKYEKLLCRDHLIKPASDDDRDYLQSIGLELDYAENHNDYNWEYYYDIDEESYQRVINCYREAVEDENLNALWCLGCALNHPFRRFTKEYDHIGVAYYYLTLAIRKGHVICIPSLCERLQRDGMYQEVFMLTYIGAQKNEIYCLWNLAMYYLCGVIVPKSKEKAIELLESILDIINEKDNTKADFYKSHYNGIDEDDIAELKKNTELNLSILKSQSDSWRKYFDMNILRKYHKACDIAMKESLFDTSLTTEKYKKRIKELMQEL